MIQPPAPRRRRLPRVFQLLAAAAWLTAVGGAATAAPAPEGERIPAFHAEYVVKYGKMTLGESTLTLRYPRDGLYHYRMFIAPRGIARLLLGTDLSDDSRGLVEAGEYRPEQFVHRRVGRDERREEILFDYAKGTVHFDDGPTIELETGCVDRLLPQLLVMRDLSSGTDRLTYRIADDGELSDYTFERQGSERVSVPAGTFRAERIQRVRSGGSSRESNAWVAPSLGNLPVKIEHISGSRTFVMELRSVSGEITQ